MKEGLLSTVNKEIDWFPLRPGTCRREYVNEVRLVFQEQVTAGSTTTHAPRWRVRVKESVKDGQKFVNKVDAGGLYAGEWVYTRWMDTVT